MATDTAYEVLYRENCAAFAGQVQGDFRRPILALSSAPLSAAGRQAIERSIEALGFAAPSCSFAEVGPNVDPTANPGASGRASANLLELIEAFDPLALIITDTSACAAASEAYHRPVECDSLGDLLGRPVACFNNFEEEIGSEQGKQRAWALLRQLG